MARATGQQADAIGKKGVSASTGDKSSQSNEKSAQNQVTEANVNELPVEDLGANKTHPVSCTGQALSSKWETQSVEVLSLPTAMATTQQADSDTLICSEEIGG
jgi:hypothetical protein